MGASKFYHVPTEFVLHRISDTDTSSVMDCGHALSDIDYSNLCYGL